MAGNFIYSTRDHKFIIKEWLDVEKILGLKKFRDYYSKEDVDGILDQALTVCREMVAPSNDDGDIIGAKFNGGRVALPPSFHKAYQYVQANGWGSGHKDIDGEGILPGLLYGAVHEYMIAANPAFVAYVGLAGGIAGIIKAFGTREQVDLFTPKMFEGTWGGTMCLTEPGGGSDVGDMLSKAYPTGEPGIYRIRGTKCFITAGDHDLTENIIHLVLARIEGAAPGTKGLSLFIVPKIWVNPDGSLGEANDVATVGIEDKMGLKGSATAVLSFGEENQCRGILLGSPPDENGFGQGMAQMFKMINGARVDTGHCALAVAAVAYHNALQYAKERVQGRRITEPKGQRVPIVEHEDVRRMLLTQKAVLEAGRAMVFKAYYYLDLIAFSEDPDEVKEASRRLEVITPLIKAYCSDQAWELIALAIQVYGGYGYTEEYPVARQARDSKIYSIWEGTNYIQSMDLVGRKWRLENGAVFKEWLEEIGFFLEKHKGHETLAREFAILAEAFAAYQGLVKLVVRYFMDDIRLVPLYSTRILKATAELYCGYLLLDQALAAEAKLNQGPEDEVFYRGKIHTAQFYLRNIVPEVIATAKLIQEADTSALEMPLEAF
ncbi:MAG: acyl-CoA dehydrogenase [Clostridia bacterium]|nr:acyl-CoA dehydrogenase [Clostridia bacterium]